MWVSPHGERIDFDEYIKEARNSHDNVVVPAPQTNDSVKELSEKVPVTAIEIANRLELLALPKAVQKKVQRVSMGSAGSVGSLMW